jgi:hypothetical protein
MRMTILPGAALPRGMTGDLRQPVVPAHRARAA